MTKKLNVIIRDKSNAIIHQGEGHGFNFERDPLTETYIADCTVVGLGTILVRKQGKIWQGWKR